ncbi:hypothetical protein ACOSQ3_028774 [Xanthoceras sorbifolium]
MVLRPKGDNFKERGGRHRRHRLLEVRFVGALTASNRETFTALEEENVVDATGQRTRVVRQVSLSLIPDRQPTTVVFLEPMVLKVS